MHRLIFACLPLLVAGCYQVYLREPDPLTTEEIIELTRQGLSPEEIIQRIRESRTVYEMTFQDGLELKEKGVDPQVIEHMLKTRERVLEREARYHHHPTYWDGWEYWDCYPPYGYYFYPHVGIHYGYCW